ncbi:MAG TPA: hypothetical protein VF748_10565 [Candidatus Acidoferrum sp.]
MNEPAHGATLLRVIPAGYHHINSALVRAPACLRGIFIALGVNGTRRRFTDGGVKWPGVPDPGTQKRR